MPICSVLELASPADIDVFAGPHKHVTCGYDICDRGLARVIPSYPEGDRNVVRGGPVGDGQQAVQTEQQLGAAIVVRWRRGQRARRVGVCGRLTVDVCLGADGGEAGEGGVDVRVDGVGGVVDGGVLAQPALCE